MSDINLLENQLAADSSINLRRYVRKTRIALLGILAGTLVLGGVFYGLNHYVGKRAMAASQTLDVKKVELASAVEAKRDDLVASQIRILSYSDLLKGHLYWTNALRQISQAVVPGVEISEVATNGTNTVVISARANDLPLVASYTEKLNNLEGTTQVVLNSSSLATTTIPGSRSYYTFSLTLSFEPEILLYRESQE